MGLPIRQLAQGILSVVQSSFLIDILLKTGDTVSQVGTITQASANLSPGHLLDRIRVEQHARWTYDEWGSDPIASNWIDGEYDQDKKDKAVLYHNKYQEPLGPLECFEVHRPMDTASGYGASEGGPVKFPDDGQSWPQLAHFTLMQHSFGNSYGEPYVGQYTPPKLTYGFDHVVLELKVQAVGVQFDRLGIIYLGDAEIWRTSTVEPIKAPGVTWTHQKDMTSFLALWKQPQKLIFDLGNLVNQELTAALNVTLTATFSTAEPGSPGTWESGIRPADVIVPISAKRSRKNGASAFVYPAVEAESSFALPRTAYKAIVSIAATGQADEEFWWSNLPQNYTHVGHGDQEKFASLSGFREVQLYIDGQVAGLVHPFPMVFTGGTAPPGNRPIVPLQTFDLREYEIDISPFLGLLSDGKEHKFSMNVLGIDDTQGKPTFSVVSQYWVLSGKVFLWLNNNTSHVTEGDLPQVSLQPLDYNATRIKPSSKEDVIGQIVHRKLRVESTLTTGNKTASRTWHQSSDFQGGFSRNLKEHGWQRINNTYSSTASATTGSRQRMHAKSTYTVVDNMDVRKGEKDYFIEQDFIQGWTLEDFGERALSHGVVPLRGRADVDGTRLETQRRAKYSYRSKNKRGKDEWGKEKGPLLPQAWTWTNQNYIVSALKLMGGDGEPPLQAEVYSKQVAAYNEQLVKATTNRASAVGAVK